MKPRVTMSPYAWPEGWGIVLRFRSGGDDCSYHVTIDVETWRDASGRTVSRNLGGRIWGEGQRDELLSINRPGADTDLLVSLRMSISHAVRRCEFRNGREIGPFIPALEST